MRTRSVRRRIRVQPDPSPIGTCRWENRARRAIHCNNRALVANGRVARRGLRPLALRTRPMAILRLAWRVGRARRASVAPSCRLLRVVRAVRASVATSCQRRLHLLLLHRRDSLVRASEEARTELPLAMKCATDAIFVHRHADRLDLPVVRCVAVRIVIRTMHPRASRTERVAVVLRRTIRALRAPLHRRALERSLRMRRFARKTCATPRFLRTGPPFRRHCSRLVCSSNSARKRSAPDQ